MTNTQTAFGAEYDSLSDMVAFWTGTISGDLRLVAQHAGKLGWLAAFVYTAGTALRLARFNTQVGTSDKRYFRGLPSPAAAAVIAGSVWVAVEHDIGGSDLSYLACLLTGLTGLLMVNNFRYSSFKEVDFRGKVPFFSIVVIMLGFAVVVVQPEFVLFLLFLIYAFSGPVMTLVHLRRRRLERHSAPADVGRKFKQDAG